MAKPIDIATHTRALTADGSDNLVVTNQLQVSTIDTSDSSAITITPAAIFSSDVSVENDLVVTNNVTATGSISDSVSNVRTPRTTNISTATTIADEGVYYVSNSPTVTLGAPATGTIMTLYNSSGSSMTLARGSTVVWFRKGADNDTVSHTSVTLGAYSTTTVTFFSSTFAVVTGTDVT